MQNPVQVVSVQLTREFRHSRPVECLIQRSFTLSFQTLANRTDPLSDIRYFPFDTLEASIAAPDRFASEEPDVPNGLLASALSKLYFGGGGHGGPPLKSEHITVGKWEQPASGHAQDTINLASALQYSASQSLLLSTLCAALTVSERHSCGLSCAAQMGERLH